MRFTSFSGDFSCFFDILKKRNSQISPKSFKIIIFADFGHPKNFQKKKKLTHQKNFFFEKTFFFFFSDTILVPLSIAIIRNKIAWQNQKMKKFNVFGIFIYFFFFFAPPPPSKKFENFLLQKIFFGREKVKKT